MTEKGVKSVCLCSSQIMPSVFLTRNLDELEVVDIFSLAFTVLNNLRIQPKYIVISSGTFTIIPPLKQACSPNLTVLCFSVTIGLLSENDENVNRAQCFAQQMAFV